MLTAGGAKLLDFGLAKFRPAASGGLSEADETRAGTDLWHGRDPRPIRPKATTRT